LPIRTEILCRRIGAEQSHDFTANSVNISTAGLLVESVFMLKTEVSTGELFNLQLEVPDVASAELIGSKVCAYGRVIRIVDVPQKTGTRQIAFQFCTRPQFDI